MNTHESIDLGPRLGMLTPRDLSILTCLVAYYRTHDPESADILTVRKIRTVTGYTNVAISLRLLAHKGLISRRSMAPRVKRNRYFPTITALGILRWLGATL